MHPLTLDPITSGLVAPPELIRIAAASGCVAANLSIRGHGTFVLPYDILDDRPMQREVVARAKDLGIGIGIAGSFFIDGVTQLGEFELGMEVAKALGARAVNVLVFDPEKERGAEGFARFCERARAHGLGVTLEMFRRSAVNRLEIARHLLTTPSARLNADVLHLVRCGASPRDLAAMPPDLIGLMQLSDGRLALDEAAEEIEAREERLIPGEGEFPLREFLEALPPGVPLSLEVPSLRAIRASSPEAWCRKVVGATRRRLAEWGIAFAARD
jgi:sugar phosphate isomerase/epimerase